MKRLLTILTAIVLILAISLQSEAKEKSLIYTIDIKKEIDNTTWIYIHNGLSEAKQLNAHLIAYEHIRRITGICRFYANGYFI